MNPLYQSIFLIPVIAYLVVYIYKYAMPWSFSATYRKIKHKAVFTLVMYFLAALILSAGKPLFFFSGALICLVGTAPKYWAKSEKVMHYIGATGSILLGLAGIIVYYHNFWMPAIFPVTYFLLEEIKPGKPVIRINKHTFYTEIVGFAIIIIAVIYY